MVPKINRNFFQINNLTFIFKKDLPRCFYRLRIQHGERFARELLDHCIKDYRMPRMRNSRSWGRSRIPPKFAQVLSDDDYQNIYDWLEHRQVKLFTIFSRKIEGVLM